MHFFKKNNLNQNITKKMLVKTIILARISANHGSGWNSNSGSGSGSAGILKFRF